MLSDKKEFVESFKLRTKALAVRIIKMYKVIAKTEEARILGRQLLRCSTSVAANYRAVNRARSKAEYIAKLGVVVEEADETLFWLELLKEAEIVEEFKIREIYKEADEILKIVSSARNNSIKSLKPATK